MTTKGQLAYDDRISTGDTWSVIAARHDIASKAAACGGAKKFAHRNRLPWPPVTPQKREEQQKEETEAEADAQVYNFIKNGGGYHEVEGMIPTQVYMALDRHSARTGAPALARNPQLAYEMRRDQESSWAEIGDALGYKHTSNVIEAASSYAKSADQPWPLT